jgi:hypothetical protein
MDLSNLLYFRMSMYETYDDEYFNNFLNGLGEDFPPTYHGYLEYGMPMDSV